MRNINVRELKRNFKSIFPIPEEGILVEYRDGQNFFIYPTPKITPSITPVSPQPLSNEFDIPGIGTYKDVVSSSTVEQVPVKNEVEGPNPSLPASVVMSRTMPTENILNVIEGKPLDTAIIGWCQLHYEKGKNYPLRKINWEDENGIVIVDKKFACPKCVKHYEDMGRGRVYFV